MIFGVARLIAFISAGSPSGNGTHYDRFLRDGDVMVGEIDGLIGAQRVACVAEQA